MRSFTAEEIIEHVLLSFITRTSQTISAVKSGNTYRIFGGLGKLSALLKIEHIQDQTGLTRDIIWRLCFMIDTSF